LIGDIMWLSFFVPKYYLEQTALLVAETDRRSIGSAWLGLSVQWGND
jgi:hypothetical protein